MRWTNLNWWIFKFFSSSKVLLGIALFNIKLENKNPYPNFYAHTLNIFQQASIYSLNYLGLVIWNMLGIGWFYFNPRKVGWCIIICMYFSPNCLNPMSRNRRISFKNYWRLFIACCWFGICDDHNKKNYIVDIVDFLLFCT